MEVKDLAGLSEPLTKLIEVISNGIGAVTRPLLIRREADATAYRIKKISEAIAAAEKNQGVPVISKGNETEIWKAPSDGPFVFDTRTTIERTRMRLEHQENQRQLNVESVTTKAAEELADVDKISAEKVDPDWIARFFSSAEDISSEQMQTLWSRILVGEIKKPGSFSLRALDFLKNLSTTEASLVEKVGKYSLDFFKTNVVVVPNESAIKGLGISEIDFVELAELGIIYPAELRLMEFQAFNDEQALILVTGDHLLKIFKGRISGPINLPIRKFTKLGSEILQLIKTDGGLIYLEEIAKFYERHGASWVTGKLTAKFLDGLDTYDIIKRSQVTESK